MQLVRRVLLHTPLAYDLVLLVVHQLGQVAVVRPPACQLLLRARRACAVCRRRGAIYCSYSTLDTVFATLLVVGLCFNVYRKSVGQNKHSSTCA